MSRNKNKNRRPNALVRFISSEKGQRFFNFAYSIGAAIVIWGALFKILHLQGGNTLLSIGMGTEVVMFLLTAFDRPPKEYNWENVFPELTEGKKDRDTESEPADEPQAQSGGTVSGGVIGGGGGTVIINGAPVSGGYSGEAEIMPGVQGVPTVASTPAVTAVPAEVSSDPLTRMADATQRYVDQIDAIADEMERLRATTNSLNNVSEVLLQSYEAITRHSAEINDSSTGYVEQMSDLNRNISGLNTIYEIQLRSVSSQLDAIERVNRGIKDIRDMYERSSAQSARYCEETEKMTVYMQQLNNLYANMVAAMTTNMGVGIASRQAAPAPEPEPAEPEYE